MAKFMVKTEILSNCSQRLMTQSKRINTLHYSIVKVANTIDSLSSFELARISVSRFEEAMLTISNNFQSLSTALTDIIAEYEKYASWNAADTNSLKTDVPEEGMLYSDMLESRIANAVEPSSRELYNIYKNKIRIAEDLYLDTAYYNSLLNHIKYNSAMDSMDPRGPGSVYFHEVGHMIDDYSKLFGNRSTDKSYDFYETLKSDLDNYIKSKGYTTFNEAQNDINNWLWQDADMKSGVSDLIRGLSGAQVGKWGHDMDYYTESSIAKEAFAHFFEAGMSDTSVKLDYIKEVFPNAYEKYLQMINDAL